MGIRVREASSVPTTTISHVIGISGEKLTEEILEIIASIQIDRSKGEYIEVYRERSELFKKNIDTIVKNLTDLAISPYVSIERFKNKIIASEELVEYTVTEVFESNKTYTSSLSIELSMFKEKLKEEMKKNFLNTLKGILERIPKIEAVYKPILRNRDTCSLGIPDYQIETTQGCILIEVKNMYNLDAALNEGRDNLLYYNSLLADLELGDSIWYGGKLPNPVKSLIVIPRHGVVEEVLGSIPNFREIATEIWKIKRAALVDGVLPYTIPVPPVCGRCQYRRFCRKKKTEQLELAKPMPLIYALAKHEVREGAMPRLAIELPAGFHEAYSELMRRAQQGDELAKSKLNYMDEYLRQLHKRRFHERLEEEAKVIYRAMQDEFDNWGGIRFLVENYTSIATTSNRLYSVHEKDAEVVLKIARKRWGI